MRFKSTGVIVSSVFYGVLGYALGRSVITDSGRRGDRCADGSGWLVIGRRHCPIAAWTFLAASSRSKSERNGDSAGSSPAGLLLPPEAVVQPQHHQVRADVAHVMATSLITDRHPAACGEQKLDSTTVTPEWADVSVLKHHP